MAGIHKSILGAIGRTPLVRLRRVGRETKAASIAVEYLNPGGSVKDNLTPESGGEDGRSRGIGDGTVVKGKSGTRETLPGSRRRAKSTRTRG